MIAVCLEAVWEMLESSPVIINRYREATIALGYEGDTILNSFCDIGMMALGFWFASRARPWMSVALLVSMELAMLMLVRDNLALNVLRLIHPVETIKEWQMAGAPTP